MLKKSLPLVVGCIAISSLFLYQSCLKSELQQKKFDESSMVGDKSLVVSKNAPGDSTSLLKVSSDTVKPLSARRPQVSPSNKVEKLIKNVPLPKQEVSSQNISTTSIYDCGSLLSGSYSGSGFYRYPDYIINLRTPVGSVSINVESYDVPNRFNIYDDAGTLVTSSGWMGYADYSGPWGTSLNAPQSKTLSFTKLMTSYKLSVETSTQDYSDSWNAGISCAAPPTTTIYLESYFLGYDKTVLSSPDSATKASYMIQKNPGLINHLASQYPATYVPGQIDVNDPLVTFAAAIHMYAVASGKLSETNPTSFVPSEVDESSEILRITPTSLALSMAGIYAAIDNTYYFRSNFFRMDWGCARNVFFGFFDLVSLVEDYVSLIRGGGSWTTVRGLLWRTAKRYLGWMAAAALVYEITSECLDFVINRKSLRKEWVV